MNQWCQLGASSVKDGSVYVRCKGPAIDEDGTAPDYGDVPLMCALGVSAVPYPPTKEGYAEGVGIREIPGLDCVVPAARDTRSAKIVGALQAGDTCVHSTGPQQAAMCIFKEEKRVAAILSKTESGKTMMLALDGTEETIQIAHPSGSFFEMSKDGKVSLLSSGGAGILADGANLFFMGTPHAGAGNIPGMVFMLGPPTGSPGGIASVPLFPCNGFAPGT